MIHAVFVPGEPPEGLLANFGVCPVDATVVAWVTVLGAVRVRSLVVLPVKSVNEDELPHTLPELQGSCVDVFEFLRTSSNGTRRRTQSQEENLRGHHTAP